MVPERCPACGQRVAPDAHHCPYCSAVFEREEGKKLQECMQEVLSAQERRRKHLYFSMLPTCVGLILLAIGIIQEIDVLKAISLAILVPALAWPILGRKSPGDDNSQSDIPVSSTAYVAMVILLSIVLLYALISSLN